MVVRGLENENESVPFLTDVNSLIYTTQKLLSNRYGMKVAERRHH
jgi:hypothetical protein